MAAALLVAAAVFVVRFIAPQTVGEQLRRHVETTLRQHYPQLRISVGRGRVEPNVGLILDDIEIAAAESTAASGGTAPSLGASFGWASATSRRLVRIDQLVVVASADFRRLLDRENPIVTQRVRIDGLTADCWVEPDGAFSLEQLWPLPRFGEVACPRVELRDAKVRLHRRNGTQRPLEVDLDQAVVTRSPGACPNPAESVPAQISGERELPQGQTAGSVGIRPPAASTTSKPSSSIAAIGRATFAERFEVHVRTSAETSRIRGQVRTAKWSGELLERLPAQVRNLLVPFRGLELRGDSAIEATVRAGQLVDFQTRSRIHDGRYRHPQLSMPVKRLSGVVRCDRDGVTLESCQAFWGDARLTFQGQTAGYRQPLAAQLRVAAENLMLDGRVAAVIPPKLEALWEKFRPHGLIDVPQADFVIEGEQIEATAEILCKGVDLNFEKFPYPVRQLSGRLRIQDDRVRSELISGRVGGRLMQCLFDVPAKPGGRQDRVFSIALDGPIAIDTELLQALTPRGESTSKLEQFVRSLNPMGAIHLVQGTLRTEADGQKHRDLELRVSDGSLRFDKFPYPLYNVAGQIRVIDQRVTLRQFRATNANGGMIRCDGHYRIPRPDAEAGLPQEQIEGNAAPSLQLDFDASRIALDESLRRSLPEDSQQTWDNLAPSGVLDSLQIRLTRDRPGRELDLKIAGQQFETEQIGADTLRLQPTTLPYRLDILEGSVRYEGGRVSIETIRAAHGRSFLSADGDCQRLSDGRWRLAVQLHNGSRLIPDAELIDALPEQLRGAIRELALRGPVGVSGRTETLLSDPRHPEPVFGWDLQLQLEGNRIGDVGPVHGLRGELTIQGRKDTRGLLAEGQVRIDSMHIDDLQVTQLRGPYRVRDDQLQLGGFDETTQTQRPIEGRLFDGTLQLNGHVRLSDASFDVQLALIEAQLPVLLADLGQAKHDLSGTLVAQMTLEGLLGTTDLLRGRGRASVKDANLYQLPLLVQLLNVLSITPTEDVAFTNADIDFSLSEDQIAFNDLKLWGSLILLYGSGTLDRRYEMDLSFNTAVSPRNTFTRLFSPLSQQRYTLWTVEVSGPLSDPVIERRALDSVGLTLERLFPGMNTGTAAKRKDRNAGLGRMLR